MGKFKDLTGKKFGRLTVVECFMKERYGKRKKYCKCVCECGNEIEVVAYSLKCGTTKSCGCLKKELDLGVKAERLAEAREKDSFEGTQIYSLTSRISKRNTSGIKGVSWDKQCNKWYALIQIKGKSINLGRYENLEDAARARKEAEEKYHKPVIEKFNKINR